MDGWMDVLVRGNGSRLTELLTFSAQLGHPTLLGHHHHKGTNHLLRPLFLLLLLLLLLLPPPILCAELEKEMGEEIGYWELFLICQFLPF